MKMETSRRHLAVQQQQDLRLSIIDVIEKENLMCFQLRETIIITEHVDAFQEQVINDAKKVLQVLLSFGLIDQSDVLNWITEYKSLKKLVESDENENENYENGNYEDENGATENVDLHVDEEMDKEMETPGWEEMEMLGYKDSLKNKGRLSNPIEKGNRLKEESYFKSEEEKRHIREKYFMPIAPDEPRKPKPKPQAIVHNYVCDICGKDKYKFKSKLKEHKDSVHDKVKKFFCSYCEKGFWAKIELQFHITSVHEKKRPFSCPFCDSTFAVRSNKVRHVKTLHEKEMSVKTEEFQRLINMSKTTSEILE